MRYLQCCDAHKQAAVSISESATASGQNSGVFSRAQGLAREGRNRAARWAWRHGLMVPRTITGRASAGLATQGVGRFEYVTLIAAAAEVLLERGCAARVVEVLDVQRYDQDDAQENACARRIPEISEGSTAGDRANWRTHEALLRALLLPLLFRMGQRKSTISLVPYPPLLTEGQVCGFVC